MTRQAFPDPIAVIGPTAAQFFDASQDCVKIIGANGELLAMNANGICLMEIEDFDALRGKLWTDLWPEKERSQVASAMAEAYAGRHSRFYADCPTAAGTHKSWEVVVWPVLNEDGRPCQLISMSRDVTELRRADNERVVVARELSHRIKNMFAVVDGVIALSARAAVETNAAFAGLIRERLRGLGRAIAYVTPSEPAPVNDGSTVTLQGLLHAILDPYGVAKGEGQRIFIGGDDATVGSGATTAVALVVNELATNALKYGALGDLEGRVDVDLEVVDTMVTVSWREILGGSPVIGSPPPGEGFGAELLENAVVRQLGGAISRDWSQGGLVVSLKLPLDRLVA